MEPDPFCNYTFMIILFIFIVEDTALIMLGILENELFLDWSQDNKDVFLPRLRFDYINELYKMFNSQENMTTFHLRCIESENYVNTIYIV